MGTIFNSPELGRTKSPTTLEQKINWDLSILSNAIRQEKDQARTTVNSTDEDGKQNVECKKLDTKDYIIYYSISQFKQVKLILLNIRDMVTFREKVIMTGKGLKWGISCSVDSILFLYVDKDGLQNNFKMYLNWDSKYSII